MSDVTKAVMALVKKAQEGKPPETLGQEPQAAVVAVVADIGAGDSGAVRPLCKCTIVFHCWSELHTILVVLVRDAELVRPCIGDEILNWKVTEIHHDLETARLDVKIESNLRGPATSCILKAVEKGFAVTHVHVGDAGSEHGWLHEVRNLIRR